MEDGFVQRFLEIRIGGRYQLCERLGAGTFGYVYLGRDVTTGHEVALKLEHHRIDPSLLDQEAEIYKWLHGQPGFPEVFWHGSRDDFRVMVFELLGPNLEDLFRFCDNRFSMKTTLMLLDQLLRRVENLHAAGHHHRDIKPENFLLGTGRRGHLVYMTDLGLASHRPPGDRRVVGPGATKPPRLSLTGTCRYASINGHMDVAASCRDDLESLGYMAIYFLRGSLPWQGLQGSTRQEKYERVLEQKQKTGVDELCRDLPAEFATYMNYLRQMRDADAPDYAYLRKLFGGLFRRLGYAHDNVFDWTIREFGRLATTSQQATIENAKRGKKPAATKRRKGKAPGRRRRARNNPEPV